VPVGTSALVGDKAVTGSEMLQDRYGDRIHFNENIEKRVKPDVGRLAVQRVMLGRFIIVMAVRHFTGVNLNVRAFDMVMVHIKDS